MKGDLGIYQIPEIFAIPGVFPGVCHSAKLGVNLFALLEIVFVRNQVHEARIRGPSSGGSDTLGRVQDTHAQI